MLFGDHKETSMMQKSKNRFFILKWASLAEECGVATHDPMS